MSKETTCPECGTLMGPGYHVGDICHDCDDVNCTADNIVDEMLKRFPDAVERLPVYDLKNIIKAEVRERFL